jgi:hypothetical protein
MGDTINAYKIVGGKLEGKKSLRMSRHVWKIILNWIFKK